MGKAAVNFTDLGDVDLTCKEGKALIAALAIITTECRLQNNPKQVLQEICLLANKIFLDKSDEIENDSLI
jgi:hypothetical protein